MTLKGSLAIGLTVTCLLGFAVSSGAAPAGRLAQVIEGAKKEGTVTIKIAAQFEPKSMYRLEKEIKNQYGVELKIKFTPPKSYSSDLAEAILEQNAGAAPSCDLFALSAQVSQATKAGVIEQVDWKPMLAERTNPNVVPDTPVTRGAIVYITGHSGIMYNPQKIKAEEVPRRLSDLANPKWRGKAGVSNGQSTWVRWSFVLGKEKVLSDLRAIMKNGAIQGGYSDLRNRYVLGETWLAQLGSAQLMEARSSGMPAEWQSVDFADIQEHSLLVRKGAPHSNASKLVALYLASPQGATFVVEEGNAGSLYYTGNHEHEIRLQNQKQGIREFFGDRNTELLEFYTSKEAAQLQKEIALTLQTGGER